MSATLESVWQQAAENHENYSATGTNEQDIRFFTLGIAGEVGEAFDALVLLTIASGRLSNLVKKRWRDGDGHDDDLRKECADVFAYNIMLARALGMTPQSLIDMVAHKQGVFVAKMQARLLNEVPAPVTVEGRG